MYMLSTDHAKLVLKLLIPIFIAAFSICVLAKKLPESKFVEDSIECLEENKLTVMEFSGATLATSLAISALPDDFATPLADTLANMNTYFVIVLVAILLERLIVVEGIKVAFVYIIPIACALYIFAVLTARDVIKSFAYRLAILGCSLVLVVPCSTNFTKVVAADYMTYVEETVEETQNGAEKINEAIVGDQSDQTIFERLTDAFHSAIQGISDLLTYFNDVIKKSINSIAILMITTIVMPLLTLLFYKWLLTELFHIGIPMITMKKQENHVPSVREENQ